MCPQLSIQNGRISTLNFNVSTPIVVAIYSCDMRYHLEGPSIRECTEDGGDWSGMDPRCRK